MGTLSRANVYDVLTNKPRDRVVVAKDAKGRPERRVIKRPEGRMVEQFVDPQGHVVWIQLLQFGTNQGVEAADRKRAEMHRMSFVEYAKCPCRHGVRYATPLLEQEFAELPEKLQRPCEEDPTIHERRGKTTHVNDPCPHIRWLVDQRRQRAAEEAAMRATKIETAADLERQKLAVAEQQLAEQRESNRRMAEVLEKLAGKKSDAK